MSSSSSSSSGIVAKVKGTGLMAIPLFTMLFVSGAVVNVFELMALLTLWPVNRSLYRRVNGQLVQLFWSEVVWLVEFYANTRVRFFVHKDDHETIKRMTNKRHKAIALANHRSGVDWLLGWVTASRIGVLGHVKSMMKSTTCYLPIIGWSWWFAEYVFLKRSWNSDKKHLHDTFARLSSFQTPYWLTIFLEGTRHTKQKQIDSNEYAKKAGYKELKHLLLPRPKGFTAAINNVHNLDYVYDFTLAFPEGEEPSFGGLLAGQGGAVDIYLRSIKPDTIPREEKAVGTYVRALWQEKDALLESHSQTGIYADARDVTHLLPRPRTPAVVMTFWSACSVYATQRFIRWCLATKQYRLLFSLVIFTLGVMPGLLFFCVWFTKAKDHAKNKKK